MSTARFEASLAFVLKWEGSKFTNDPNDHGGATRFGIIQREYDAFRRRRGQPTRSVNFITMDEVRDIYRREYWEAVQGDRLPIPLDMVTFDSGVLMGVGRAIRFLQQSLNVSVDGTISQETRDALAQADADTVAARYTGLREARLRAIVDRDPTQEKFLRGWLNRLNDLRRTISHPELHNLVADAEGEEKFSPEEGVAAGRAIFDLPEDFPEEDKGSDETPSKLSFFETVGPTTFIDAIGPLGSSTIDSLYIINARSTNQEVLRVVADLSSSEGFEIPVSAVESVTPLCFLNGDPTKIVASILFRHEFQSLAATFKKLSVIAYDTAVRNARPVDGSFAPPFSINLADPNHPHFTTAFATDADEDPGSPAPSDLPGTLDLALARTLANYGAVEPGTTDPPVEASVGVAEEFFRLETLRDVQVRTMPLDISAAQNFLTACRSAGVSYGPRPGAKVPFHGATPGRDFKHVDCSGFVREAIWRATAPHLNFIDGSVRQHDWIRTQGFTRNTPDDAQLQDGAIRIAFLRQQDSASGIGHVALVHNARTLESHGGVGPDSRAWTKTGWQAKAFVYFLDRS